MYIEVHTLYLKSRNVLGLDNPNWIDSRLLDKILMDCLACQLDKCKWLGEIRPYKWLDYHIRSFGMGQHIRLRSMLCFGGSQGLFGIRLRLIIDRIFSLQIC